MIAYKQEQLKLDFEGEEYTLFLKKSSNGGVSLMAKQGITDWYILTIDRGEPITLHSSCPRNFIVPVDNINKIPLTKKEEGIE